MKGVFKKERKKFFAFDSMEGVQRPQFLKVFKKHSFYKTEMFQKLEGNRRWARKGCVQSPHGNQSERPKLAVLT